MNEWLAEIDPEIITADGFDDAIIGYVERFGNEVSALYDKQKCIQILMEDMTEEEANEYLDFNILGAYISTHNPAFATLYEKNEDSKID